MVDGQRSDNSECHINNSLLADGQMASICEDTREDHINTNPSENGQITDTCESHIMTDLSVDDETADPHESQISIGVLEGASPVTDVPFNNQVRSELPQDGQRANTCEMHSLKSVSTLPDDNQVSSETSEESYVKGSQVTTSGTADELAIQTTNSSQVNIGVADEVHVAEELIEINIRPRSEIHQGLNSTLFYFNVLMIGAKDEMLKLTHFSYC